MVFVVVGMKNIISSLEKILKKQQMMENLDIMSTYLLKKWLIK